MVNPLMMAQYNVSEARMLASQHFSYHSRAKNGKSPCADDSPFCICNHLFIQTDKRGLFAHVHVHMLFHFFHLLRPAIFSFYLISKKFFVLLRCQQGSHTLSL